ncbi:hypothetical protein MKS88_000395 [Plasmodium brasilianum]|uniref:Uncharacterized protein n=1 Tax=Plasmodium brasilianum TaxID=5824 RepID=A0ACB9YGH5_PLABR|nr:hypothetical protein MKS88_000395 [Plasmodium brasilianum]
MVNSEFQEQVEFNYEHNLKEKSPILEHYDNIQNNKYLPKYLEKFYSKNNSTLCHFNSNNKYDSFNYEDKINATANYKQKHSEKSTILVVPTFLGSTNIHPRYYTVNYRLRLYLLLSVEPHNNYVCYYFRL